MSTGYSGTPLPRKLGIKAGQRIAFLDAPAAFDATWLVIRLKDRRQV